MTKLNEKGLHPRNIHREFYNFEELKLSEPSLAPFVRENSFGNISIDFANPSAVIALNKALLKSFYEIENWDIPKGHLCPPIPGRVDYLHYMADLLAESNKEEVPKGKRVKVLDIGMGANCIYPLIGNSVYGWKFVGSDSNSDSINSAKSILKNNPRVKGSVKCRFQGDDKKIFNGIIKPDERFDFTMCNPPFHSSKEEARDSSARKVSNLLENSKKKGLKKKSKNEKFLNFGGVNSELWCPGGEVEFISKMIKESLSYKENCLWFSTLVSKKESLDQIGLELKKVNPCEIKIIEMNQGKKITRIIAWTFKDQSKRKSWYEK